MPDVVTRIVCDSDPNFIIDFSNLSQISPQPNFTISGAWIFDNINDTRVTYTVYTVIGEIEALSTLYSNFKVISTSTDSGWNGDRKIFHIENNTDGRRIKISMNPIKAGCYFYGFKSNNQTSYSGECIIESDEFQPQCLLAGTTTINGNNFIVFAIPEPGLGSFDSNTQLLSMVAISENFFYDYPSDDPEPEPDPTPEPDPDPTPDPTPEPDPTPDPTPEPDPEPEPGPDPDQPPSPSPEPEPLPKPDSTIDLDINLQDVYYINQYRLNKEALDSNFAAVRLLMPRYDRRVWIEDINRNFWVIGNAANLIFDYFIGNDSPIGNAANSCLKEVYQLWDNMLYLYDIFQLRYGKIYSDIKVVFASVPTNGGDLYKRYDNNYYDEDFIDKLPDKAKFFHNNEGLNALKEYYKNKYSESHIILLPYYKCNNYQKNYFSKIVLHTFFFYDRNSDQWINNEFLNDDSTNDIIIDFKDYKNKVYAIREDRLGEDQFYVPFDDDDKEIKYNPPVDQRFYCGLRVVPIVNPSFTDGNIKLENFQIDIYDAVKISIAGKEEKENSKLESYNFSSMYDEDPELLHWYKVEKDPITIPDKEQLYPVSTQLQTGLYLGELISSYKQFNAAEATDETVSDETITDETVDDETVDDEIITTQQP